MGNLEAGINFFKVDRSTYHSRDKKFHLTFSLIKRKADIYHPALQLSGTMGLNTRQWTMIGSEDATYSPCFVLFCFDLSGGFLVH